MRSPLVVSPAFAKASALKRWSLVFIIIFAAYGLQARAACAIPVNSKDLIDNAKELDGKTVTYKGEAVTAIMARGANSWINLNDGINAIGIWCKNEDLFSVRFVGDYKHRGDVLEVTGIFNRACSIHNGDLDIHPENIRIVQRGGVLREDVYGSKVKIASAIFLVTLLLTILFRKRL